MQPPGRQIQMCNPPAGSHRTGRLMMALLLLLLSIPASGTADEAQYNEYRIKTAFLHNFMRFVI
jgi:hypothetical protein